MGILRDAVRAWAAEGFKDPEFQDDPSGLRSSFGFPLKDEQLELSLFVDSDDEASCLSVFAYLHLEVPEARRAEVAALLALNVTYGEAASFPDRLWKLSALSFHKVERF